MIAPQRTRPSTVSPRPRRIAGSRTSVRRHPAWRGEYVATLRAARPSLWQIFLDDRRALRLKWGLLVLLLVIAALLDVPL